MSAADLIVEDGSGLSTANSYATVAEADAYHATYTGSTDWSSATENARAVALIQATRYLDTNYYGRWAGQRCNVDQALAWPRMEVYDSDGYWIDSDQVPQKLKAACCELALRLVLGDDLLGVVTEPGSVASESITVGPITESYTYIGGKPHAYMYPKIERLLLGLIEDVDRVYRG